LKRLVSKLHEPKEFEVKEFEESQAIMQTQYVPPLHNQNKSILRITHISISKIIYLTLHQGYLIKRRNLNDGLNDICAVPNYVFAQLLFNLLTK